MSIKNEHSLQQFIDLAIEREDYDLVSELVAQEAIYTTASTPLERLRRSMSNQAFLGISDFPSDMDCSEKRSIPFGE